MKPATTTIDTTDAICFNIGFLLETNFYRSIFYGDKPPVVSLRFNQLPLIQGEDGRGIDIPEKLFYSACLVPF